MTWHRLDLGAADLADADGLAAAAAVDAAWRAAGRPAGFVVYERPETTGGLHCHRVLYFAPGAAEVARRLGARACPDPGAWDLAPLAGDTAGDGRA